MAEGEDEGARQGLGEGDGPEEHRQHEEAVIPAVGDDVREALAEEVAEGEAHLADDELAALTRGHVHDHLRIHPAAQVGEHRPERGREHHLHLGRVAGDPGTQLGVEQDRVALLLALLGGLGLDLDRGRERDELDRRLLPVDEDADPAQELRRLARVGGRQPARVEHQVVEFLDGGFLRVLADEVGRDIELDR